MIGSFEPLLGPWDGTTAPKTALGAMAIIVDRSLGEPLAMGDRRSDTDGCT